MSKREGIIERSISKHPISDIVITLGVFKLYQKYPAQSWSPSIFIAIPSQKGKTKSLSQ